MSTAAVSSETKMQLAREFEEMFREHSQMMYRTAYSMLDSPADAEDVLQTIFLRLLRRGLPPELQKNARGYLYRTAVNQCLDIIRSRKRHKLVGDAQCLDIPANTDASSLEKMEETQRRLAEAIAELDPAAAHILILRYVHNYKDSEIAKLLGTSRGTIAMRLFRSRARLKKLMHSLGEK